MNLTDAKRLAEGLMADHGLPASGWTFTFDSAERRMGVCRYQSRSIGISRLFAAEASEREVRDVALHEIAHALVGPGHKHDHVWKAKARQIGATPKSCGVNPYAARVRDERQQMAKSIARSVPEASQRPLTSRAAVGERVVILDTLSRPAPGTVMLVTNVNRSRYVLTDEATGKPWAIPFEHVRLHVEGEHLSRTSPRHPSMSGSSPAERRPKTTVREAVMTGWPHLRAGEEAIITVGKYAGTQFTITKKNPTTYSGIMAGTGIPARVPHHMLQRTAA